MAEQSVDVVVLRQHSVQETLPKEVVEQKIAVIKEEKKKEAEEKEAKKKEEMELALSVCCSPYCAREFNNPCYDSSKRLLPKRTASITSYCTTVTWSLEMRMVTTSPVSPSSSAGISTVCPARRTRHRARDLHRLAALSEANAHQLLPIGEGTVHFVLAILVEVENDIGYDGGRTR